MQEAREGGADAGTIRFYTDEVGTLSNAFDRFESGELNILREFARFSPRTDSPFAGLSVEEIADELRHYERNQRALDDAEALHLRGANAMEVDDGGEIQDVDFNLNGNHSNIREVGPDEPGPVHGPLDHNETLLQEINDQRTRVLAEIEEHLAGPLTQEEQWYWYTVP